MNEDKNNKENQTLVTEEDVKVTVISSTSDEWAQKKRIYKNLLVVAFSYLFFFSAANGLNNLQSSLNSHDNLGVYTLLCSSIAFLTSCLFVPVLFCRLLGFKWSLILCETVSIVYIIANYYPSIYTLIPAGILFGAALSVVWTLQGSYIVHISNEYYAISSDKKHTEKIMFKFFGIFMIVFQLNQISGNLISAIVFNESAKIVVPPAETSDNLPDYEQHSNLLLAVNSSNLQVCGTHDCPGPGSEIKRPADEQVFWLCMCYFILTIIGILLLLVVMDDIRPSKEDLGSLSKSIKDIFKMFLNKKTWALLPLLAFLSTYNTFIIVDFSKSYIACLYGIKYIGNAFILCGLASSLFSFFVTQLTKVVNKTLILVMALSTVICIMAYLKLGEQSFSYMTIVYVLPLTFGLLEGVWGTVINALIGIGFADENTTIAFSNNRFTMSMFFFITYSYSGILCVYMKIYLVIGLCLLSIFSSTVFELLLRKEFKAKSSQANFANS